MLLYYLFWMFMGFIKHFYIIFGTNLLTGGPSQIDVFFLFQCFAEKEYQTESKRNETFGKVIFGTEAIQGTWSARQGINEEGTRQGGAPTPWAHPPPSWVPRDLICLQRIYNFLLFHAIILSVLDVNGLIYTLLYYFWD